MAWNGFLSESKYYMNYPRCGRIKFWSRYPVSWIKFKYCMWQSLRSDKLDWKFLFKHRSSMCDAVEWLKNHRG